MFIRRCAQYAIYVSCLAGFALAAAAQDKMELRKVADDVYMMENMRGSGNSSFVITPEGVLVYDADIRTADQALAEIRKLTDKKVRYLVLSHSAGDHATGGWHFREDNPVVIATRRQMRDLHMQEARQYEERMASTRPDDAAYRNRPLRRPDIGFDGAMTLQFGGLTFQLTDEGHGHSTSDLTVYIPQKRVFLMGDLLSNQIHPGQAESGNIYFASIQGTIDILDRIMKRRLPVDTYVPGHGAVAVGRGVADLEQQQRYFIVIRDAVARQIQAGRSLKDIQDNFEVPAEFAGYQRKPRLVNMLNLFYTQVIDQGFADTRGR